MSDIDSMQPGADMDRLVEAAIGIAPQYPLPRYSADWNAAMDAAARFGLFNYDLLIKQRDGEFTVRDHEQLLYDGCEWTFEASAPTGPHAICRAILKLSEGKQ